MTADPAPTADLAGPAKLFRLTSWITTALIVVQVVLAVVVLSNDSSAAAHGGVGYITLVASIAATFFAWQCSQRGASKGIFYHALAMSILMVVQVGLGSMDLKWVHVGLGILIAIGVIGMAVRSMVLAKNA